MKCLHCGDDMVQGGDHDVDQDDSYNMVSNFSCQNCDAFCLFYFPEGDSDSTTQTYKLGG